MNKQQKPELLISEAQTQGMMKEETLSLLASAILGAPVEALSDTLNPGQSPLAHNTVTMQSAQWNPADPLPLVWYCFAINKKDYFAIGLAQNKWSKIQYFTATARLMNLLAGPLFNDSGLSSKGIHLSEKAEFAPESRLEKYNIRSNPEAELEISEIYCLSTETKISWGPYQRNKLSSIKKTSQQDLNKSPYVQLSLGEMCIGFDDLLLLRPGSRIQIPLHDLIHGQIQVQGLEWAKVKLELQEDKISLLVQSVGTE